MTNVSPTDRAILRGLATKVAEIANLPRQKEIRELWRRHNRLEAGRPMVLCFPEGAWGELLPGKVCQIQDPTLRGWEHGLRMRRYAWEHLRDDQVIEPYFDVGYVTHNTGWGLAPERVNPDSVDRGTAMWKPALVEPGDLKKLRFPEITIDHEKTQKNYELAQEVLGDILQVRTRAWFWWSVGMIGTLALMRGMEQLMVDMLDRPEWVHEAMQFMRDGTLHMIDSVEKQKVLTPNNGANYVGSGGIGITDELTPAERGASTRDLWGFAESQEVVGISPAMHDEFLLQYQIPVLERFGLNYYGCCEQLHRHLENLKKIPRLRRISISPWADLKISAQSLQGKYIFCWKPNPAILAMESFSEERVRQQLREALELTRGCVLEIIMKDTHTIRAEPERLHAWTRIAREMVNEYYPNS